MRGRKKGIAISLFGFSSSRPSTFPMVRLLTHNILACHAKDCNTNNFPLEFKDVQLEIREAEFNPEFLKGFLPKLEWKALVDTAIQVSAL
jgi:hypothetical protein